MLTVRVANPADVPTLAGLIPLSARELSRDYYSPGQIESAVRYVFGVDTQLVRDRTYFVVEAEGLIVGCGGWSRRRTLYGGDQAKTEEDPLLDPAHEAARIRAFFVHPEWAGRGVGARLLETCLAAAAAAGFDRVELMATLPGGGFYAHFGFEEVERVDAVERDGVTVPFVRMARCLPA